MNAGVLCTGVNSFENDFGSQIFGLFAKCVTRMQCSRTFGGNGSIMHIDGSHFFFFFTSFTTDFTMRLRCLHQR